MPAFLNGISSNIKVTHVHRTTLVAPASACTVPLSRRQLLLTLCLCMTCMGHRASSTMAVLEGVRHAVPHDWVHAARYISASALETLDFRPDVSISNGPAASRTAVYTGITKDMDIHPPQCMVNGAASCGASPEKETTILQKAPAIDYKCKGCPANLFHCVPPSS